MEANTDQMTDEGRRCANPIFATSCLARRDLVRLFNTTKRNLSASG